MRKTVFSLAVLVAASTVAQADPLKLKIGDATGSGEVAFTLAAKGASDPASAYAVVDSVRVSAPVAGPMSAQDKAALVRDAVARAGVAGTWRAVQGIGVSMSFERFVNGAWAAVDVVENLSDTTGSGTQLQTKNQTVAFTLDIESWAMASGFDAMGGPSFLTVAVTNTLAFTRAIQPGDTPETLVNEFEAFLVKQEAEGVTVTRTGPTALSIALDASSTAAINWQITDTGLLGVATASAVIGDDSTGRMVDR